MKNKNGTAIFLGIIVFFLLFAYFVVFHFVSDMQHEIDSGVLMAYEIRSLTFMQGIAIYIYIFAITVTLFVLLYFFTH